MGNPVKLGLKAAHRKSMLRCAAPGWRVAGTCSAPGPHASPLMQMLPSPPWLTPLRPGPMRTCLCPLPYHAYAGTSARRFHLPTRPWPCSRRGAHTPSAHARHAPPLTRALLTYACHCLLCEPNTGPWLRSCCSTSAYLQHLHAPRRCGHSLTEWSPAQRRCAPAATVSGSNAAGCGKGGVRGEREG